MSILVSKRAFKIQLAPLTPRTSSRTALTWRGCTSCIQPVDPQLEITRFQPLSLSTDIFWFQSLPFKSNLHRYNAAALDSYGYTPLAGAVQVERS
jgi:hypothetical protein